MANRTVWSPPEDPQRPNCPYLPGFAVNIQAHVPPAPFGSSYYDSKARTIVGAESLGSMTQTKLVLNHPPLETAPPLHPNTCRLVVTKSLTIGNARGAQLVVCSITPTTSIFSEPFVAVAKIFDPLYYSYSDDLVDAPVDVIWEADKDYSHEAAAYEHLIKVGQAGTSAPKYFGSWTFTLPISDAGMTLDRPIRLLLIEHLDAPSMMNLFSKNTPGPQGRPNALHYDEEYRLEVLARLLDVVVRQRHRGLDQRDLAPRNIIIIPPPYYGQVVGPDLPEPRVVLVDYNHAIVFAKTKYAEQFCQDSELPWNPAEWLWDESLPELYGWIPPEWYEDPGRRQEWLLQRFGGSIKALYAPLREETHIEPGKD